MDELIDFKKRFLKNGELVSIPKKESYKRIMLLWAVSFFELRLSTAQITTTMQVIRSFRLIVCCHSSILIMPC